MAAVAEAGRILQAGYIPTHEGFRPPVSREHDFPSGTYLEALNPLASRMSAVQVPDTQDWSFLLPDILLVYQDAGSFSPVEQGSPDEGIVIFPNGIVTKRQRVAQAEREAGQNTYLNPRKRKYYTAQPAYGTLENIPALADNLYELAENGLNPTSSMHYHPRHLLSFPTLDDWMPILQQWRMGSSTPLLNATMILGEVPVMAQMTAQSHRLLSDRECLRFRGEWVARFTAARQQVAEAWKKKLVFSQQSTDREAQQAYLAEREQAEDRVRIALAEKINAKMFIGESGAQFVAKKPGEIISLLRERQLPPLGRAA